MDPKYKILIIEDELSIAEVLKFKLKQAGYETFHYDNGEDGLLFLNDNIVDIILLDFKLPGMNGEEFFVQCKKINPLTPVLFMTFLDSIDKAVELLQMGAYTFLTKPINYDLLFHNINNVLEKITLQKEIKLLSENITKRFTFENYIFNSQKMQNVINISLRGADSSASILITGDSGTGKEVIANIIHNYSARQNNKFIKVNIATLPETLLEAELFGAEKGAYTGSVQDRKGKFEEADGGTLFLDEIGEMNINAQVKLLRVLQEREFTPLGSNVSKKIDIRLITATNKSLEELINEGKFRQDLFYRLNVIEIQIPPLKERKEEIPKLIDLFIEKFNKKNKKKIEGISKDAVNQLIKYNYPGNIRELENIIERAIVLSRKNILSSDDLPLFLNKKKQDTFETLLEDSSMDLNKRLNLLEKSIIEETLKKHKYNKTKTAKELGVSNSGLGYKIQTLNIEVT